MPVRNHLRVVLGLATAALCVLAATGGTRTVAEAHGTLDQSLSTDPGCLTTTFHGSAPQSGSLRQEFVPSGLYVAHIALCLTLPGARTLGLNIRSGTAAAPGPILGSQTANVVNAGTKFVEFELATLIPVTPGTTYVLEVIGFPTFDWRGACVVIGGAGCSVIDTPTYAPGVPNGAPPEIGDLAFRTYTSTDADGDLIGDPVDNCPGVANVDQLNSDANFIDLTPPKAVDDLTWINSDALGDACDADADNDGLSNGDEATGASCIVGGTPTLSDPLLLDTDGDRFADGAECTRLIPTSPADSGNKPLLAACPGTTDADLDGLADRVEVCYYNSNPNNANSDGDLCNDAKEVASLNNDNIVNPADQGLLASEYGPAPPHLRNMDLNRDGVVNVADMGFLATKIGPC